MRKTFSNKNQIQKFTCENLQNFTQKVLKSFLISDYKPISNNGEYINEYNKIAFYFLMKKVDKQK